MRRKSSKGFSQRESWLPFESRTNSPEQRKRWISRAAFTGVLALLVAWFSYLLFPPLFHPNVHFLVFTAADYSSPELAPISYFQDDAIRFISLSGDASDQNFENRFVLASRSEDLDVVVDKSAASIRSPNDVVLLYASFQVAIRDNRPFLLCRDFEPSKPNLNTIDFADFLARLQLLPAKRVAVFLDIKNSTYKGLRDNNSSDDSGLISSLDRVISELDLPKIIVMTSHSEGQSSYASARYQASAFSIALDSAFRGGCDRDNDKMILLQELFEYVSKATSKIVEEESNGYVSQIPELLGVSTQRQFGGDLIASVNKEGFVSKVGNILTDVASPTVGSNGTEEAKAGTDDVSEEESGALQSLRAFFQTAKKSKSARIEERIEDDVGDFLLGLPSPIADRLRDAIMPTQVGSESTPREKQDTAETKPSITESESVDGAAKAGLPSLSQVEGKGTDLLSVVQICWTYISYLEKRGDEALRPIDLSPFHWQTLKKHIHQIETKIRCNAFSDERRLRLELYATLIGLNQWVSGRVPTVGDPVVAAYQSIASYPSPEIPLSSLGLCEHISKHLNFRLDDVLLSQIAQFDDAIRASDSELFTKWLSAAPAEVIERHREFQYAQLLAPLSQQSWLTCQTLLQSLRRLEQLSFQPNSFNRAFEQPLLQAHQSWLEAFRCATDQIGDDWAQRTQQMIDRTSDEIRQITRMQRIISEALQCRNEALAILPALVEWAHVAKYRLEDPSQIGIAIDFIDTLDELCTLLMDLRNASLQTLEEKTATLDSSLIEARKTWDKWSSRIYAGEIPVPSHEGWIYDALLTTTVDYSTARSKLLKVDRSSFARTANTSEASTLQLPRVNDNLIISKLINRYDSFTTKWTESLSFDSLNPTLPIQQLESLELQSRVSVLTGTALDTNQQLAVKVKLLLANCVVRYKKIMGGAVHDSLATERGFLRTQQTSLKLLLDIYFAMPSGNDANGNLTEVETRDLEDVYLETEIEGQSEVVFKNRGAAIERVWLLLDYDPSLIEIKADSSNLGLLRSEVQKRIPSLLDDIERRIALVVANQSQSTFPDERSSDRQLSTAIDEAKAERDRILQALVYPVHPSVLPDTPRFSLAAGQEFRIRFKVRRLRPGPSRTKLSWKLISEKNYLRSDLIIHLPSSDNLTLVADTNNLVKKEGLGGMQLLLNPNRPTEVKMGLLNEGRKTRVVDIMLYSLDADRNLNVPAGWLDSAASLELKAKLGTLKTLAQFNEFQVEASRRPKWLQKAPAASEATPQSTTEPPAKEEQGDSAQTKKGIPISDFILANIVDRETGKSSWEKIELRVRHPRSYVNVEVGYDSISELMEIELNAIETNSIFEGGIRVAGRISEALPRGTEMQLTGSIQPGKPLRLYCRVPATAPRQLTLELDIDGYPRAFVISVPCWKTSRTIPVLLDQPRLSFQKPDREIVLGPSRTSTPVELRVDALPGAFDSARDLLELGWDLDQDREFSSENPTRLRADRMAEIEWASLPSGSFLFQSKVSDIQLNLAHPPVTNRRIQLLAKLLALGDTVWSDPISIIVDEESPIITGISLNPGPRVAAGESLIAKVGAEDGKLSGVAKVMLAVDANGITSWDQVGDVINCNRLSDATWSASVPTTSVPPGKASLLAIAEDRAGNRSLISRLPVEFLDPEVMAEEEKRITKEVVGSVSYLGSMVPDAKVTLLDEKGEIVLQTKTNASGVFRWSAVAQGKYKLGVSSVIKNKPRRSETDLVVEKSSKPSIRTQIELK